MRWILLKWTWETIILIHIYKDTPHTSAWEWEGLAVMVCGALTRGPSSSLFSSSHSPSLSSFFPSHRTALQYNSLFQQTQLLSTSLRLNYDRLMKAGCWKMLRWIHGCVVLWMGTRWHMLCCYVPICNASLCSLRDLAAHLCLPHPALSLQLSIQQSVLKMLFSSFIPELFQ